MHLLGPIALVFLEFLREELLNSLICMRESLGGLFIEKVLVTHSPEVHRLMPICNNPASFQDVQNAE